jgi:hypothetical protein
VSRAIRLDFETGPPNSLRISPTHSYRGSPAYCLGFRERAPPRKIFVEVICPRPWTRSDRHDYDCDVSRIYGEPDNREIYAEPDRTGMSETPSR